ncbi:uncharacterized protein CTRU02_206878 [Colletotrichum truncatum]|uniref:Uncharacterized protein n=1 Tax=Colletotrichum truncatum TaxID=5467 RepID=A0ACC3YZ98_COLTU|nr:uncharacterized protein CTRU02_14858 [Colletotrichum truncatum]KAF6781761.1 hypothetical protein CTRU02_14858 [Colletotrichum truncatum]
MVSLQLTAESHGNLAFSSARMQSQLGNKSRPMQSVEICIHNNWVASEGTLILHLSAVPNIHGDPPLRMTGNSIFSGFLVARHNMPPSPQDNGVVMMWPKVTSPETTQLCYNMP